MRTLTSVLAALLSLVAGCSDAPREAATPGAALAPLAIDGRIRLLSFSDLHGYAEGVPCDPDDPVPLASARLRRQELASQGETVRLAIIGDALLQPGTVTRSAAARAAAQARGLVIMDAMAAAGVDVWVPGQGDLELLGARRLLEEAASRKLTVLVSNLAVDGLPDRPRHLLVRDGTLTIALLGAIPVQADVEESVAHEPGVKLTKPGETLGTLIGELKERREAQMFALLSNLSSKVNQALADAGDVDFILGVGDSPGGADRVVQRHGAAMMFHENNGQQLAETTFRVKQGDLRLQDLSQLWVLPAVLDEERKHLAEWNETYGTSDPVALAKLITPGNESNFIAKYTLHFENVEWVENFKDYDGSSISHREVELAAAAPDDPVVRALERQGPAARAAADALATRLPDLDPESTIPRPDDCRSCHEAQYTHWAGTEHARAYDHLMAAERHRESSCLNCHAAGFGRTGGFTDPRLDAPYGGYTCWNCHGTKVFHYTLRRGVVDPAFVPMSDAKGISANCTGCHTERRSPGFELDSALAEVTCPPMRRDEPAIVEAYAQALAAVERNRDDADNFPRDAYLEGRALIGLGRRAEGFALVREFAMLHAEAAFEFVDMARYLDREGDSAGCLDLLRHALEATPSDPTLNHAYVDLLLHATDPAARDPALAATYLDIVAKYDLTTDMDAAQLPIRVLQVEALMEAGQLQRGRELLAHLLASFRATDELTGLAERYFGP